MNEIKTVLITGSGSGIGKDSAITLAKRGYHVLATTHFEEQAEELNKLAKIDNLSIESFKLDITLKKDRELILNHQVDILINNAGIGESGSLTEIDVNLIRKNFETNLFSSIELTQLALKGMISRDSGKIIFISSLAGRAQIAPFLSVYSMTKYAISAGAESLHNEIKMITDHIYISVVEPGAYYTGFNQKMMATKFKWMDQSSYFFNQLKKIKDDENRQFRWMEYKSTKTIVNKIVQACESNNPRFRYSAPWWQSLGVRTLRILGK